MSSDYSSITPGILGQAEAQYQKPKTAGANTLSKDAFLTLLVTQMKYQDPLNPTSDKEFLAQLAQFSSLEQLTNVNAKLDTLNTATTQQQMFTAAGFIGKEIKAKGDVLSKAGASVSKLFYTLPEVATKVGINVLDANNNVIRTVDMGSQSAGEQSFAWDGKDWNGNAVPDGLYHVGITTQKADGTSMLVDTTVTGTVSGVASDTKGGYVLTTKDGRSVNMVNVLGLTGA